MTTSLSSEVQQWAVEEGGCQIIIGDTQTLNSKSEAQKRLEPQNRWTVSFHNKQESTPSPAFGALYRRLCVMAEGAEPSLLYPVPLTLNPEP